MDEDSYSDIDVKLFPSLDKEEEANERVTNSPLARLLRNESKSSVKNEPA